MSVTFQLPDEIELQLRKDFPDLDAIAKQSLAIEAVRAGKLSVGQFASILGISVYEADGVLKKHRVYLDLTEEESEAEMATLRRLLPL